MVDAIRCSSDERQATCSFGEQVWLQNLVRIYIVNSNVYSKMGHAPVTHCWVDGRPVLVYGPEQAAQVPDAIVRRSDLAATEWPPATLKAEIKQIFQDSGGRQSPATATRLACGPPLIRGPFMSKRDAVLSIWGIDAQRVDD
jgi:hypothetical protein